ncbi:hypothetical protein AJ80_02511 [Polytolypa hystricis UAMH7299]|uniref:Large ribosomal subunit protein uL5m n=1 Tax=Polytolypa hystricis (strain UAMH7299) TaxID=1447883 RepID=A0A2B7YQS2_POLH7|nr:hypothetical protein AJ80_02511 [Polytolypa hystricis UAMH7299]
MAFRESSVLLSKRLPRQFVPSVFSQTTSCRRNASTRSADAAAAEPLDLEPESSLTTSPLSESEIKEFDPIAKARARTRQLPRSRYQFRSPKYYRGPLHPHQPPAAWDPSSRVFVPGPFTLPRTQQTYESTIAQDIMTLCYVHNPPGFKAPVRAQRLRDWDDSSPYNKNRQLRGPRGGDVLRLLRKPILYNNVPKLAKITVHSYIKQAATDGSGPLHVGGMAIQAITNVRVQTYKSKSSVTKWSIAPGRSYVAVKAEMVGENMLHFMGKLIDVVMPKMKDWKGISGGSGDSSGNITFGLEPEMVALFPEIEVNYDMYPQHYIPGCHITIHTTARTDKDARLLLSAMGIPFQGKFVQ